MDWKDYEIEVFNNVKECFPDSDCTFNSKILGKYSKGYRQCDVIVKQYINGSEQLILVDAKYYTKKIDVKCVEEFLAMARDINADKGMLVTPIGYTELAYERAENDPSHIILDILTLEEIKEFQGYCAVPYAEEFGVLITAPFGWVIDANSYFENLAYCYRKGFDFDKAWKEKEFIYFNIWNKKTEHITKEQLLENQYELLCEFNEVIESSIEVIIQNEKSIAIRKTLIKDYLSYEYACAIDFDDFIFFGILISENNRESVNLSKLTGIISNSIPIRIEQKKRPIIE